MLAGKKALPKSLNAYNLLLSLHLESGTVGCHLTCCPGLTSLVFSSSEPASMSTRLEKDRGECVLLFSLFFCILA